MLYEIMRSIRNFFPTGEYEAGSYEIKDGKVSLPFLSNGQYFMIEGSKFNDGVYKYPAQNLTAEKFDGNITALNPPKAFLDLVAEIEDYQSKVKATPYASESFGGYSYQRATNSRGNLASWQDAFGTRLNAWRKL